jgi:hypothetical protein
MRTWKKVSPPTKGRLSKEVVEVGFHWVVMTSKKEGVARRTCGVAPEK